jgi:HEAT repeat protein
MGPLPDGAESDPVWDDDANLQRVELLIALADEVGDRRLVVGIAPLFERAALGDVFEMMQGIRHGPERAVEPDWGVLTAIMRPLAQHERAGCRRWAVRELGVLRDPAAFDDLVARLEDTEEQVRAEACMSLVMMRRAISEDQRSVLRQHLERVEANDGSALVRAAATRELARLTKP